MTIKTSINVKFDFAKSELFDTYLPTPSHAEAMNALLRGINGGGQKSHIILGPYGTGKSLLGTLIAGMASKQIEEDAYQTLINKFDNVDESIYTQLIKIKENKQKLLPVFLNGNEGRFRDAILSSILNTLKQNNISITVPGVVSRIISTVEMWEDEFPKTFKEFKKKLKEDNKDFELWRLEVLSYNSKEIDWFKNVFPMLTAGTSFLSYETEDFTGQVKYVLDELKRNNLGLIVVYDEFGRFLQSLNTDSINETMQDLQDIAELSNDHNGNLHNVFIAHKNLRQYFAHLSREFQQEFQRIEKRYGVYYIDNDRSTFLRLGQQVIQQYKVSPPANTTKEIKEDVRKYPLFKELNNTEIERLVVKGFYPMHPVATFLLPELSKVFGQNERTLFTFLESDVSGGLRNHIKSNSNIYLPYQLFDYFFQDIDKLATQEDSSSEYLTLYNRVRNKTTLSSKEDNLLKLLSILKITGSYSKVKVSTEFLSFAFSEDVQTELRSLGDKKVIRFNYVQGYWEIYDGSSINLEQAIDEKYSEIRLSYTELQERLLSLLKKKFFLPSEYNHEKSMTRFAKVNFIVETEITSDSKNKIVNDPYSSDMTINYLIPIISSTEDLINKAKDFSDPSTYYVIDNQLAFYKLEKEVKLWKACELLLEEESLIREDPGVIEELEYEIEELKNKLYKNIKQFDNLAKELIWVREGEVFTITDQLQLENNLSKLMFALYPDTPEILNDSFNRRTINRVQKKAAIDVINAVLNTPEYENVGIQGTGPDYLIYATIFKNNGVKVDDLTNIKNNSLKDIRENLSAIIEKREDATLKDLIDVMTKPPYGIRKPIVPVLLTGLLRDKWEYLVFYKNDMFIAGLNGEIIYEMIEDEPEAIYVKYYSFDETSKEFFEYISDLFSYYIHESMKNKPRFLQVTSALLEWLRSLPKYAQLTEKINPSVVEFKETIRYAEIDPNKSLDYLKEKWLENSSFINLYKKELEAFTDEQANQIVTYILKQLSCDSFSSLLRWIKKEYSFQQKTNPLIYSIINSNTDSELAEMASNEVIGVSYKNWSDVTAKAFYEQVTRYVESIYDYQKEGIEVSYNGKIKTIRQVEMSPKTQTLYKNVHRILKNGGRTVSNDEIETLVFQLMEEFVE
ncbi:hypothetical protein ACGTN9_11100 [Halobacillus sp. MO56]